MCAPGQVHPNNPHVWKINTCNTCVREHALPEVAMHPSTKFFKIWFRRTTQPIKKINIYIHICTSIDNFTLPCWKNMLQFKIIFISILISDLVFSVTHIFWKTSTFSNENSQMSLIRHSPYESTSSENVGPTVLTQPPDNHNKKNWQKFNNLYKT